LDSINNGEPDHKNSVAGRAVSPPGRSDQQQEQRSLPLPPWFHPPLALPAPPKQELPDQADTESIASGPAAADQENNRPGSAASLPLLLSPPLGPLGAPLDPRHIIHFLTRKVCQLFRRTFEGKLF
jgi:hypothetical protein